MTEPRLPDLPDGTALTDGLVVSRKGGYNRAVYRCECGREQSAASDRYPGGLSAPAAEVVGWRRIDGRWTCPLCTGNTTNLFKLFKGDSL